MLVLKLEMSRLLRCQTATATDVVIALLHVAHPAATSSAKTCESGKSVKLDEPGMAGI